MSVIGRARVAVIANRDFEELTGDPENRARADIELTADAVVRVLKGHGFDARVVPVSDDVNDTLTALRAFKPAVVFNLCESLRGDNRFESLMPQLMELEGMTYTGSGPLALTMALHKDKAKDVLRAHGVPTPQGICVTSPLDPRLGAPSLRFPFIVKPTREDASVGVCADSVVRDAAALRQRVAHVVSRYHQPALCEEYVEGREIYVSILERCGAAPDILPLHEIDFAEMPADRPRIVSYEGKWNEESPEYNGTRPVRCTGLDPEHETRLRQAALAAFTAMELRDYGRLDVRLAADGTPYIIDVNPNCDLSQSAGFARAARAAGLAYEELVLRIVQLALGRRSHADTIPLAARSRRARSDSRSPADLVEPDAGQPVPARGGVLRARAPRRGA